MPRLTGLIGLLNRIKHLLPLDARVALYNALIRPLFDFADTIWGDRDNITLLHDLQGLQNKAAKVILCFIYRRSQNIRMAYLISKAPCTEIHYHFKYIHGLVDHNFNILRNSDIHITLEEGTTSVFLSLRGITESRDFFINALRNGTF